VTVGEGGLFCSCEGGGSEAFGGGGGLGGQVTEGEAAQ